VVVGAPRREPASASSSSSQPPPRIISLAVSESGPVSGAESEIQQSPSVVYGEQKIFNWARRNERCRV